MGSSRVEYTPLFLDGLRALDEDAKTLAIAYVKEIAASPLGPSPRIKALPPPFQPGTMAVTYERFLIRYAVSHDDTDGSVRVIRFIKITLRW